MDARDVPALRRRIRLRAWRTSTALQRGIESCNILPTMPASKPPYALSLTVLLAASACLHTPRPAVSAPPRKATVELPPTAVSPAQQCDVPILTAQQHVAQHGTALDRYQLEGGVWLPHAPVLVNRDFDFALAVGMDGGIGPAVAAAKRKKENVERAAGLTDLKLSKTAQHRIEALRCQGAYVYFVLWEGTKPALRAVIDSTSRGGGCVVDYVVDREPVATWLEAAASAPPSLERCHSADAGT